MTASVSGRAEASREQAVWAVAAATSADQRLIGSTSAISALGV